jgi:[ribosomal protein S5]-alanine N-acetyltransferase
MLPPTPTLETVRLTLRPLCLEDAPAIQRRFPQWEIVRWLNVGVPWPYPVNGAETYIQGSLEQRARGERFFWAILPKGSAEAIGTIDLWPDDGSAEQRGFWLDPEFHGRGLITEAAECVTGYAFLKLGWPHLRLANAAENKASRRIKEKQGATLVGREPAEFVSGAGIREIWLLAREDWLQRRSG